MTTKRIDNGIDQETGECVRGCCEVDTSGVAAHTPGPWRMHLSGSDGVYILPDTGDRREDVKHIAIVNGRDLQTDQRNARLIAAAPELLQALREFIDDVDASYSTSMDIFKDEWPDLCATYAHALAAIQKAEGRD